MNDKLRTLINDCTYEVTDIERRINLIKESTKNPIDKEIHYLTNYVLIKTEGTVEFVYRSIVVDYFSEKFKNSKIDEYLKSSIMKGSMSAKYDNMKNLIKKFDEKWCKNFTQTVEAHHDGQKMIAASKSLVDNRHAFAHGENPTVTFQQIKQYYQDILKLIDIFDSVVNADSEMENTENS